jgi:integrase
VRRRRHPQPQRAPQERVRALTGDQLGELIDATRCPACQNRERPGCERCRFWQLLVSFLGSTGLRIGEAAALQQSDIDFGRRRINVKRRYYRGGFAPPKSTYGTRGVPISTTLAQALWQHCGSASPDTLAFASTAGSPLDAANAARRVLKPAAERIGQPWVSWHTQLAVNDFESGDP